MDIVDPRIDQSAQQSLIRKMGKGPPTNHDASAMIVAIKEGRLAGILLPFRPLVGERARLLGHGNPNALVPPGRHATCVTEPASEPPLMVYRTGLGDAQIDAALSLAWPECGLPTPVPPCDYTVVYKPPPKPEEPEGGSLEVRVFWSDLPGSPPAAGALVSISGPREAGGFRTNGQGVVLIDDLPEGDYEVSAMATPPGGLIPNATGSATGRVAKDTGGRVSIGLGSKTTQTQGWSVEVLHPEPPFVTARVCVEVFGIPGSMKLCLEGVEKEKKADHVRIESETRAKLGSAVTREKQRIRDREMQNPAVLEVVFLDEQQSFSWKVDDESMTVEKEDPDKGAVGSMTIGWKLQGRGTAHGTYRLTLRK